MLAVSSQWRTGGFGFVGLDYNAVFLVAGALGLAVDEPMLRKIQLLEEEELGRRNKRD